MTQNMTTTEPARAGDFTKWAAHARTLDESQLEYVIQDCRNAAEAMRGWNPVKEGYYADQASTYSQELMNRNL